MKYKAIAVDIVPGESAERIASDNSSEGYGDSIREAETEAIRKSAVNCDRRVYVQEDEAPFRVVKGPYRLSRRTHGSL